MIRTYERRGESIWQRCWSCDGAGREYDYRTITTPEGFEIEDRIDRGPCEHCEDGWQEVSRDEAWNRRKSYGEKFPRFVTEVPPEIAELLDLVRRQIRKDNLMIYWDKPPSRAALVRRGLRMLLNEYLPEQDPALSGEVLEEAEIIELAAGDIIEEEE